jgi:predicted PurR-regulated permease PerM
MEHADAGGAFVEAQGGLMTEQNPFGVDESKDILRRYSPTWLVALGIKSWLAVGFVLILGVILYLVSLAAGLVQPLILAVVIGMLFYPLVDGMEKRKVPRAVGAALVMLLLIAIAVGTVWITAGGILSQTDEIVTAVQQGVAALEAWLETLDIPAEMVTSATNSVQTQLPKLASGLASSVGSGLTSLLAFGFGLFLGAFMLFYVLSDWHTIAPWVGSHLGYPEELGVGMVQDSTNAVRGYYKGVTISSIWVAVLIGVTVALLGLPLAIPIALVTFFTAYIPYLGAILSGAFAFIVALGSGGIEQAVIVLVVVLLTQNIVQTVVSNKYAALELDMHPLVALIATILGGTFAGLIGAILGAPFAAVMMRASQRVKAYKREHGIED